ncbi:hypothetical protein NQ317_014882 [Molorchus minor]|uniref:Transposase n=1 Tax=Molorchus minor TaxID=1323400 RepID=A0ABQ9JET6_9CUCU|nr:hypothetical protein NQ317_014882 [Molorchus minor]
MPNKKIDRPVVGDKKPKGDKLKPTDIDDMIQKLKSKNIHQSFIKFLVYIMERQVYGVNYNNDFLNFCLSSNFILKHRYTPFSVVLGLPDKQGLEDMTFSDINLLPGITQPVLDLLKIKTEHCEQFARLCVLIVDETALKPEIQYCDKTKGTIGYEDNGKVKTEMPAQFVTNIWVQCIGGQWMMPFAYYFTNTSCTPNDLKEYISEAVTKLDGIGIDILGVVTKMRTNFYDLIQVLNISPNNQIFKVGEKELVFIFDVPQLMNITRNNMMKYKLKFEDNYYTSWKYVKQFFIADFQGDKKTKLTLGHVKPDKTGRTRATLAIELLSNSVSTEMKNHISQGKLPESAIGTAEFIDKFDKLFDILNSTNEISMNEYCNAYKGNKRQVNFMEKMIDFMKNLKVFNGSDQDCTDQVKFINGWLISLKSIMKLWEMLNKRGYPYLLTRNITSEALDGFVWLLRWQIVMFRDPTPSSFLETFYSFFSKAYFEEPQQDFDPRIDIQTYAKKVYKRIPAVRHNINGKTKVGGNTRTSNNASRFETEQPFLRDFNSLFLECDYSVHFFNLLAVLDLS